MGKKKTLNSKKNNSYSEASQNFTREPSEHVKTFKDSSLLPKFQHAHPSNCPRINTIAANWGFLFFVNHKQHSSGARVAMFILFHQDARTTI